MLTLKAVWKFVSSRPVLVLTSLGVGFILAGECMSFREHEAAKSEAHETQPAKEEAKAERITLEAHRLEVLRPRRKDLEELAREFRMPELLQPEMRIEVLAVREVEPLPNGGKILVTADEAGNVGVKVKPNEAPTFDLRAVWEMGALAGIDSSGANVGRAFGAVEFARWGRLHARCEGGVNLKAGETNAYAVCGSVWRSE